MLDKNLDLHVRLMKELDKSFAAAKAKAPQAQDDTKPALVETHVEHLHAHQSENLDAHQSESSHVQESEVRRIKLAEGPVPGPSCNSLATQATGAGSSHFACTETALR